MGMNRILAILLSLAVSPVLAGEIAWPDPKIPVPGEVLAFISNECHEFRGWGEENRRRVHHRRAIRLSGRGDDPDGQGTGREGGQTLSRLRRWAGTPGRTVSPAQGRVRQRGFPHQVAVCLFPGNRLERHAESEAFAATFRRRPSDCHGVRAVRDAVGRSRARQSNLAEGARTIASPLRTGLPSTRQRVSSRTRRFA